MEGKGRILAVDDDENIRVILTKVLEKRGYNIDCVKNGKEAFSMFNYNYQKDEDIDLIIMDIKLQGKISGLNAAKEIRRFCNVPIIFITALADMLAKDNLKKEKNIVCLSKPFSNIEFTGHIKKFLNL